MTDMAVDAYEVPSLTVEVLESHQQTPEEVARNNPKFHQYRAVWKEQQATTHTIITDGGVQDSQDKPDANVERFSRRTYP